MPPFLSCPINLTKRGGVEGPKNGQLIVIVLTINMQYFSSRHIFVEVFNKMVMQYLILIGPD